MNEPTPLRNTFKEAPPMEYEALKPGMHICGLIEIKNCQRRAFQSEEMIDAFRFVFRSFDNEKAFVNHTVTATSGERSNCYKTLKKMTGGSLDPKSSSAELFDVMQNRIGHWFTLMVEQKPYKDGVWVNVVDNTILPDTATDKKLGDCREYFGSSTDSKLKDPKADNDNIPF
jgi:hypothetical protein